MHVHVYCAEGEAKFWLEPDIKVAKNWGLSDSQIIELTKIVKEHKNEIRDHWKKHFKS
ncbi:DUF4160 domain-containing protein [bacterium]|nr:DUF4160 domain-containing protein [bacterium]